MKETRIVLFLALGLAALAVVFYAAFAGFPAAPGGSGERAPSAAGKRVAGSPGGRRASGGTGAPGGGPAGEVERGPRPPGEEEGRAPEKLTPEVLADLLDRFADENDWEARRRLEDLLKYGPLEDPLGLARVFVEAVGKGGNHAAIVAILLPLLRDEAAKEQATRDLLLLAEGAKDPQVLKAAFLLLGRLGSGAVVPDLARLARAQERRETARAALAALADVDDPSAAAELASLLRDLQGTRLEDLVIRAIRDARSGAMARELKPLLDAGQPRGLKLAAARAIGLTRSPEAVAPLRELFAGEGDREVRQAAIEGLGYVGNAAAARELIRIYREGGELAPVAGMAIGNVAGPDAAAPILEAIDTVPDAAVKDSMVKSLGNIGGPEAEKKLREYLASPEETARVRGLSARGLAKSGDTEAIPAMAEALAATTSADRNLRIDLAWSLQHMSRLPKARPLLAEKVLPVVRRLTSRPVRTPDYFYLLRLRQMLEGLGR